MLARLRMGAMSSSQTGERGRSRVGVLLLLAVLASGIAGYLYGEWSVKESSRRNRDLVREAVRSRLQHGASPAEIANDCWMYSRM